MSSLIARTLPALLATLIATPGAEAKPAKKAKAKTETTVLQIENLSTKGTTLIVAGKLQRALRKLKGVRSARVDRAKGTVTVTYRGADTLGRVYTTLSKRGFKLAQPKSKRAEPTPPPDVDHPTDDDYDPDDDELDVY